MTERKQRKLTPDEQQMVDDFLLKARYWRKYHREEDAWDEAKRIVIDDDYEQETTSIYLDEKKIVVTGAGYLQEMTMYYDSFERVYEHVHDDTTCLSDETYKGIVRCHNITYNFKNSAGDVICKMNMCEYERLNERETDK